MKKQLIIVSALVLSMLFLSTDTFAQRNKKNRKDKEKKENIVPLLISTQDSISYILGADIAKNFQRNNIKININPFMEGLKLGFNNADTLLSEADIMKIMTAWQEEIQKEQENLSKATIEKNKKIGEDFLANNKLKEGVKTTKSGLQYKIIKQGEGQSPKSTDVVKVHYKGTLIDGTTFDSSYERGEPAQFPLNRVIAGWTEGLQLMKPGANFIFYIPSDLGYGNNKTGSIPEASTLIFEVELLEIVK